MFCIKLQHPAQYFIQCGNVAVHIEVCPELSIHTITGFSTVDDYNANIRVTIWLSQY